MILSYGRSTIERKTGASRPEGRGAPRDVERVICVKRKRVLQKLLSSACALAMVLTMVPAAWAAPSFSDVRENQWFASYVNKAVDAGLMDGVGEGRFNPGGNLTLAQAAVLAYQLHSRDNGGSLPQVTGAWYMPYYRYCLNYGIFSSGEVPQSALSRNATRYEMVSILDRAVPNSQMKAINDLPDDFIPDIDEKDPYRESVYRWYRAGALTGDSQFRFNGENSITRAEVAVILCQVDGLVERVRIEPAEETLTGLTVIIPQSALSVGETTTAALAPIPADASIQEVVWSSDNSAVATVNQSGVIIAMGAGSAVITATAGEVTASGTVTVTAPAAADGVQAMLEEVVRLTNEERAKEGLPALEVNELATQAAAVRAEEVNQLFEHTRPNGKSCFTALDEAKVSYRTAGENIAIGYSTPASVVDAWMNSPGHRANILSRDFSAIGVGYDQNGWVQLFIG